MANPLFRGAVLVVTPVLAGSWFWLGLKDPMQLLAVLGLALSAVLGALWLSRAQAARRWRMALDAYADRALAEEKPRHARAGR